MTQTLSNAVTMLVMTLSLGLTGMLTSCGTDGANPTDGIPTTIQADPKTGEVSIKGEKGDRGDKGETGAQGVAGPKGDTGAAGAVGPSGTATNGTNGADGKTAEVIPSGSWKDPVTGKYWLFVLGTSNVATATAACAPWTLPSSTVLKLAIQHGLTKQLPVINAAATEMAWTSDPDLTDLNAQKAMGIISGSSIETYGGLGGYLKTALYRVYCSN